MKRGDKLETLIEKSENLKVETKVYKARAREVKKAMWYQKYKLWIILGLVGGVFAVIIILWVSGIFDSSPSKKT
jgi:hypothetical protein